MLILDNFIKKKEFVRPPSTHIRNMKLVQAIMKISSENIDDTYKFIEDFLYWKNVNKTLLFLNLLVGASLGMLAGL